MFSNMAQNDFKPLKEGRGKARWATRVAQPWSRLVSRVGSPVNAPWDGTPLDPFIFDPFDTALSATDHMSFWLDPLSDFLGNGVPDNFGLMDSERAPVEQYGL